MALINFIARKSLPDLSIIKGRLYYGKFVYGRTKAKSGTYWRIEVTNDRRRDVTYDPDLFRNGG